ncbi:MAG: hypothetical protein JW765_09850 [Deltaproteobacteria bacterium]|nr:hypothetical protein [Candidatus Zymogenaceae bacterium]
MVSGNSYSVTGPPVLIVSDPAKIKSGADPKASGRDTPPGGESEQTDNALDAVSLERLVEQVGGIMTRLDALIDAVGPLIQASGVNVDMASQGPVTGGIEAVAEALIYTDFFREAINLGMAPDMVADAFRMADLANTTVDLETKGVSGVKEAVDALLNTKPYLFFVHQGDVGLETNPTKGPSSFPEQVEGLARTLGVSPEFAAELVKKRSDKAGVGSALSEIWRVPRANRLSFLETND